MIQGQLTEMCPHVIWVLHVYLLILFVYNWTTVLVLTNQMILPPYFTSVNKDVIGKSNILLPVRRQAIGEGLS